MKSKQILFSTGAVATIAALAFAHHVPVGLSHLSGPEIVREVAFYTSSGTFGVASHRLGTAEVDDGVPVGVADGDSFTVMDENGAIDTVVLQTADFADIANAPFDEVLDVIASKAVHFEAVEANGYLELRGLSGGSSSSLTVVDGAGSPLGKMNMTGGVEFGRDDLELTLSIPDPNLNLVGHPYVIVASATDGSVMFRHHAVPIGPDALTSPFLQASLNGVLAGFSGVLDGNSDASALLTANQIQAGFNGTYPDKLYFSFLVFGPNGSVAYVSNQFVVDFR